MAYLYPDTRSMIQILASRVIQVGELPKHVAIIMDGNRRYARSHGLLRKLGHRAGLEKAKKVSRWGYELQIPEITLYTFSIENYNRSQDQIDELIDLMDEHCAQMITGLKSAKKFDCCVQVIGNWDLIPAKIKPDFARLMLETRHCKTFKINLAIAYTGRNGIERSMQSIQDGIKAGQLLPQDICEYLIDEAQNLLPMRPVDIMLRTGGDSRISDFMLMESTDAYMHFIRTAWPDLSFFEVADALVKYQLYRRQVKQPPPSKDTISPEQKQRVDAFLISSREKRWKTLERFAVKSNRPATGVTEYEDTLFQKTFKQLLAFK